MTKKKLHWLRSILFKSNSLRYIWGSFKSYLLKKEYFQIREYYNHKKKHKSEIHQDIHNLKNIVLSRLKNRNCNVVQKKSGNIKTYFFSANVSWHHELLDDLKELGPTKCFDYTKHGFKTAEFYRNSNKSNIKRNLMNQLFFEDLKKCNSENKVDWIFIYANGYELSPNILESIRNELSIPMVLMCLDDKHSWIGKKIGIHRGGQIDIAKFFDLNWTSSSVARDWYQAEGGCPILLAPGFNKNKFYPNKSIQKDIPISFLGAPYGYRLELIDELRSKGLPVYVYGPGWEQKNNFKLQNLPKNNLEVIHRSQINLGCGNIGYSSELFTIKGRDFDIPGSGGMYITSYAHELADNFVLNKEIVCYRSISDLTELLRYYISNPDKCEEIGNNARILSIKNHRWIHRFNIILKTLGIIN